MTIRYSDVMSGSASSSGSILREARHRAGLSQADLARRAAVTQSVISAYESGKRQPALATLERLVAATGLTLDVRVRKRASPLERLSGPLGRRVRAHRKQVREIAQAHNLANVRVFGSVARGEETMNSDIDLLVDVPKGIGLLGLARAEKDLRSLLNAPVDLVPADGLKPDVARHVLEEALKL